MVVSPAWRMFRRMQYTAFAAGALIYAAAVVHAWARLPGKPDLKLDSLLLYPGLYFAATLAIPLAVPPVRRVLSTHIWISFRTGFGQSVISVLSVVLVLGGFAWLVFADTERAHLTGHFPSSAFAAYAAGVGVLLAQAILVREFERDPVLKTQIEVQA